MLFKSKKPDYVESHGHVLYLDGSGLKRPFNLQRPQMIVLAAFTLAAIGIGAFLAHDLLTDISSAAERTQASVEENLNRKVPYNMPELTSLIDVDNATIEQNLVDAGYTIYNMSSEEDLANNSMQIMKLPDDVSVSDAMLMMSGGIGSLNASQAALLLNGSWTLDVQHGDGTDMRMRYADFTSGSVQKAIDWAVQAQGFDPATMPEEGGSGEDEAGNTFMTGTIDAWGYTCTWRVSAIALSDVYDISGLPDDAVYVGIRLSY